jgi:hypothetical protein
MAQIVKMDEQLTLARQLEEKYLDFDYRSYFLSSTTTRRKVQDWLPIIGIIILLLVTLMRLIGPIVR